MVALRDPRAEAFPVTHSVLSAPALLRDVLPDYDIPDPTECQLVNRGLNDTYLVTTPVDRYILRVYRAGWRRDSDVQYEIDVLNHLRCKGIPVAAPIARRDGAYTCVLQAPEGRRQTVLFRYAKGQDAYRREDYPARYGRAVARVHTATDDFRSEHNRFPIDLGELLDTPLLAIQPHLRHRPDDWHYLVGLAGRLRDRVAALPGASLEWGFCHGDFHGGNAQLDGDTLTFFDFDCCGPGWRAYDVAVFLWNAALGDRQRAEERWVQFLDGYREHRQFGNLDLAAVPLFVAIRDFWLLGLHTGNAPDFGHGWIDDRYFDEHLKFLKEWETARLEGRDTASSMASCG